MAEIALRDYLTEIGTLIEGNSYDEAIAHSRRILEQYPKCLEAYRLMGKAALEKEDDRAAIDLFQRVLSADPEDFVARVGLSIVYDRQGQLDPAVWQMERGFELMPSNDVIQTELRRLYSRRDGVEPERIGLTRGALARMYAQGELYTEAIAELRALLKELPDRVDLQILLAEVLWRDEQRNDASSMAEQVLDKLPHCLTANLLLGEIWLKGGFADEGETHLRRAQSLDPDNLRAHSLLGAASPLNEQTTMVNRLEYSALPGAPQAAADDVPEWLTGLAGTTLEQPESAGRPGLPPPESGPAIELGPAAGAELPDWLTGFTVEQPESATVLGLPPAGPVPAIELGPASVSELPDWLTHLDQAPAETPPALVESTAGEVPDWMTDLSRQPQAPAEAEAAPALPSAYDTLDWMRDLSQTAQAPLEAEAAPAEAGTEEMPDWMRTLAQQAQPQAAAQPAPEEPPEPPAMEAETPVAPDWLSQVMAPEEPVRPVAEPAATQEPELPDWLADLAAAPAEPISAGAIAAEPAALEQAELPDWLQAMRPPVTEPAAPPVELPEVETSEIPDWMAEVQPEPVADEALSFLQRLGETVQIEPSVEQQPPAEVIAEPVPPAPVEELPVAETPGQPALPIETQAMPSAEEALAFLQSLTAGKEAELQAEAEREAEQRMGAIIGGRAAAPAQPAEPIAEAAPVPEPPPAPVEIPPAPALEAMPSAEEALAFLQSLTAGKEDELRAQAEREAEQRIAAITGEPVAAPAQPAEPIAEAMPAPELPSAPVEAPPVPAPETMPSAEEALAFLQRLTVGKEDELRAQAERAADQRLDALMGVKPGTSPLRRRWPAPVVEVAPELPLAPTEAPAAPPLQIPETMPSPDEAMAFLQSLTVGKEEELRAFAESEGERRMDAIMGGKPGTSPLRPRPAAPAIEVAPEPPPAPAEAVPAPVEAPAIEPVAELPAPEPEFAPSAEQALAMLQGLTAGEEAPAQVEPIAEMALAPEVMVEPAPAPAEALGAVAEMPGAELLPQLAGEVPGPQDALAFLEGFTAGEPGETMAPEAEAVAEAPPAEAELPVEQAAVGGDYWLQVADDEGEEPITDDYFVQAVKPQPITPKVEAARLKASLAQAVQAAAPALPPIGADEFLARLKSDPNDEEARLGLARVWWAIADREQALKSYQELIQREAFLDEVGSDLQRNLETFEDTGWYRALGDTHMKLGNLSKALDAYRQALTHL